MTEQEAREIIRRLCERQTFDTFDKQAILDVIAPHPVEAVVRAIVAIRRREPFVGAHNLAAELDGPKGPRMGELALMTAETRWLHGDGARERMETERLQENLRRVRHLLENTLPPPAEEAS